MAISNPLNASRVRYKLGCLMAWVVASLLTLPVLYFADVILAGDDGSDQICKITWIHQSRSECQNLVQDRIKIMPITRYEIVKSGIDSYPAIQDNEKCPFERTRGRQCGQSQKPLEHVYLAFVIIVAIVGPISFTMFVNYGIVSKVTGTVSSRITPVSFVYVSKRDEKRNERDTSKLGAVQVHQGLP